MTRRGANTRAVNTWVPPAFGRTIDRIAESRGMSKAALVREALIAYLLGSAK
jgi:hypothetical protein